ncbi:hypothetical protein DF196_01735 [Bifidobacterium callitrichidarum]|uniref:FtsK domain-containing protein n=2 Tax=Bifidobacterium callitrichidarum TaxID=2052941 RepID=A0A2U2NC33_9BIFI|nr:hypothetical protein DF196_01735 [Bifidobacterium callitrichidarum]
MKLPVEEYAQLANQPLDILLQALSTAGLEEAEYRELVAFAATGLREPRKKQSIERSKEEFLYLRQRLGLSQQWIADRLQISVVTVRRWEDPSSSYKPDDTAWQLLDEYGKWEYRTALKAVNDRINDIVNRRRDLGSFNDYWYGADDTLWLGLHYYRDEVSYQADVEIKKQTQPTCDDAISYMADTYSTYFNQWSIFPEAKSFTVQNAITSTIVEIVSNGKYDTKISGNLVKTCFDRKAETVLDAMTSKEEKSNTVSFDFADQFYSARRVNEYVLGKSLSGQPVIWNTDLVSGLLVTGKAGSGKSVLEQNLVVQALRKYSQVIVIDPFKLGSDFNWAETHITLVTGQTDYRNIEGILSGILETIHERNNLLESNGCQHLNVLPNHLQPQRILLLFCGFDAFINQLSNISGSYTDMTGFEDHESQNASIRHSCELLSRIAITGRSTGVNILLDAQLLSESSIDRIMNGRALYKCLSKVVMGDTTPAGTPSPISQQIAVKQTLLAKTKQWHIGMGVYSVFGNDPVFFSTDWNGGSDNLMSQISSLPSVNSKREKR